MTLHLFEQPTEDFDARSLAASAAALPSPDAFAAILAAHREALEAPGEVGAPSGTAATYAGRARAFGAWCATNGTPPPTTETLRRYAWWLFRSGRKRAYVKQSVIVARLVFRALHWGGAIAAVPELPRLKDDTVAEHEKRTPPPWEDVVRPLRELRRRVLGDPTRDGLRLAVAVHLMAASGLRKSEVLGLRWSDVDLSRRVVRTTRKGGKHQSVEISRATAKLLTVARELVAETPEWSPVISRLDDPQQGIGRMWIFELARAWESAAGLPTTAACHILRHAGLTHMAERGRPLTLIRDIAGHRSVATTQVYVARAEHAARQRAVDDND